MDDNVRKIISFVKERDYIPEQYLDRMAQMIRMVDNSHTGKVEERDEEIRKLKEDIDIKNTIIERQDRELTLVYDKMVNAKADLEIMKRKL